MGADKVQYIIAMTVYIGAVIAIGFNYAKRASESTDNYLIGGRSLGPWVTAMAAEASDMSGWLLMGLPGVAYWCGLGEAFWTAIGLFIGTYLNWLIVAKRLRTYSHVAGDAITIPDFLSNRFKENKKIILTIAALFILVFFSVYAASCFVTVGKLFSTLFNTNYKLMMVLGALFVVLYTFIGGFLAESASDFMQGIVMFIALSLVLIVGVTKAGGISEVFENAKQIPGFLDFFGVAQPQVLDGIQQVSEAGNPLFEAATKYGPLVIISTLSWGLGYFGMPHVLLKFMAIENPNDLKTSRRIAIIWCGVSLFAAVFIGIIGRVLYPNALLTKSSSEGIFVLMSSNFFLPLIAGIIMAGILAATISSSDSYLLIAASAFSKNIYHGIIKKDASDKQVLYMSRVTLILISIIAMIIAMDENSVIFTVVSFAWAGFGATFGPIILFSLFWKRVTRAGAIAGMLSGGVTVFVWNLLIRPLGGYFDIYELFPAFVISCLVIVIVSLCTLPPSQEIQEEFEQVKNYKY
ncbi:sodium/proline symporter PutP [Herbinix luporum]|jgi:sodium/proline symporter|uniref:Sodium/proline symporter n=1 Tax=Herbinix luporum TaxID=1679721 RepID=A0A0K8J7H0_9FIRM|nr:sodium/proline symporter PutP [Herbinix luporum]MDI9489541.1 sodium/proline symporter PutP [Bacillota bacterium]CUH93475.1 putative membrane protein [Herbinix luporum]HHT56359.1 sodium/proline symporter PutP [Herbinix luporum]